MNCLEPVSIYVSLEVLTVWMCMSLIVPQVGVGKGSHPGQVKVFGPGVERTGLKADQPTHFTVDCTGAGEGNRKTDRQTHLDSMVT